MTFIEIKRKLCHLFSMAFVGEIGRNGVLYKV